MVPQYLMEGQWAVSGCFCWLKDWRLHLADELTTEGIDDTGDGRLLALADEVEVKHALDGLGLHSAVAIVSMFLAVLSRCEGDILDETSCLGVEELVVGLRSECSAGRGEACDVVVGRGGLAVGHSSRSHCCCVDWMCGCEGVFPG